VAYGLFSGLVDTGKVRSRTELRSLYRRIVKKYHPDSSPERGGAIDFDELKREYLEAASRLEAAGSAPDAATPRACPFAYDPAAFVGELRDLVARGLPVSARAVRKNREYAKSIDYVSKCMDRLYGGAYGFPEMNDQMKFLYARMPRAYWYVLQTLWCCFDCASGYSEAATIADRHRGCISDALEGFGFGKLDAFLGDLIGIAGRLKAKLRLE
jgi:hypothetical protein